MIFFGTLLGIVILGATAYMALDKKSNFTIRLVCLGAIAVMIVTIIICLFIIFTDKTAPLDPSTLIVGEKVEVKEENNILPLIISVFFLLTLFLILLVLVMREHKKEVMKK